MLMTRQPAARCLVILTLRNSGKLTGACCEASAQRCFLRSFQTWLYLQFFLGQNCRSAPFCMSRQTRLPRTPSSAGSARLSSAKAFELDAMGTADTTIAANYRFRVAKSSSSGSSLNMQSGDSVLGRTPKVLTTVALDQSAIDHYNATLSLKWDGGHVSCVAP